MEVHWLRLCDSTAGDTDSIPGLETEIPQAMLLLLFRRQVVSHSFLTPWTVAH